MHPNETPITTDLVLIGGGHSHVAVLKSFGMSPHPGLRITLVSPKSETPYSGMIPGYIAGRYSLEESHIELRPLCRFASAQFYQSAVTGMDLEARHLLFADRPPAGFDLVSIDIGSTPSTRDIPATADLVLPVKPIDRFIAGWQRLIEQADPLPTNVGVVGAGAGGVELILSLESRLRRALTLNRDSRPPPRLHLISPATTVLPSHNRNVQTRFHRLLKARHIQLHLERRAVRVRPGWIDCQNGNPIPAEVVIWATDAAAAPWIAAAGLATDPEGFIAVNECLQSISHPFVFAAGDIAAVIDHPRPKSGVFAVRQGPPLTVNLRRALDRQPLIPFKPQKAFLSLIGTGESYAVASRGPWASEGAWAWKLKDWIDRRWMAQYRNLPDMPALTLSHREPAPPAMRCGGCGAKVGSHTLLRVLARLVRTPRDDLLVGLDSPDDAAATRVPAGKVCVQSIDQFRAFIDDPYLFGRIAAIHALGDIFAMGAEPQSALAIVTLPPGKAEKVEEQLFQLMTGANEVLRDHQTALAGGHTAEGLELTFGLSVQGFASPGELLRKRGVRPADRLVLTKPLGTGTLLAADMRRKATGRWILAALEQMQLSSRDAARSLLRHHANACTDVTGFGLIGHLHEMIGLSDVDAMLWLDNLPILEGALETISSGILSTLHPENLRLRGVVQDTIPQEMEARFQILFDPQTAGGLLAAVPEEYAPHCVSELRQMGYAQASVIGKATNRSGDEKAPRISIERREA